jgi:tetratricopeptide (TPR) repeat protein
MILQAMRCLILILLLSFSGCDSGINGSLDEQKDPHYLNGRSRVAAQDYKGAVEEFEKALEANPRSASAHFELGWLNEEQMKNYAAAIYHYEQHLRLRPDSDYAERAKDRIRSCKMDLVKNEVLAPVSQGIQRDLERLSAENLLLKRQIEALQNQLAERAAAPPAGNSAVNYAQPEPVANVQPRVTNVGTRTETRVSSSEARYPRSHVVKSGDTIISIANKYGVKLNVMLSANPKVDPRRLQVGQTLNIPAQ